MLLWTFDRAHHYGSRSVQRDMACETLLERAEADDEVSNDFSVVLALNVYIAAPGNKRGIILHACYDSEELVGTIGKDRVLRVTRHVKPRRCSLIVERIWLLWLCYGYCYSTLRRKNRQKGQVASSFDEKEIKPSSRQGAARISRDG